jgi:hypothetical protein
MKTYFNKDSSFFCLDDIEQSYTQINVFADENVIVKGTKTQIFEYLMSIASDSTESSEGEFLQKKLDALNNIGL